MGQELESLKSIDGQKLSGYLAGQEEFRRAFPLFFRAVGDTACRALGQQFPGIWANVGEDHRREAIGRINDPQPPLGWVAFGFPGYSWWDLHVGVVARLDVWPVVCQAGFHWTGRTKTEIEPLVRSVTWESAVGERGELAEVPAFGEIQQRDPARPLDVMNLAGEAERFAERAIRYYSVAVRLIGIGGSEMAPKPPNTRRAPGNPGRSSTTAGGEQWQPQA